MSMLSKNFNRVEFACKCGCGLDTVDAELVQVIQEIRNEFGVIHILSGSRCKEHNRNIGGLPRSLHLACKAADFTVRDMSSAKVGSWVLNRYSGKYGIGIYHGWIHLDVRDKEARW